MILRNGLEAGFEAAVTVEDLFARLLPQGGFLRQCRLIQKLILGLFILQHPQLGIDSGL
jgi:hypothetical protein